MKKITTTATLHEITRREFMRRPVSSRSTLSLEEPVSFAEFRASFNGEEIVIQDASGAEVRRIEGNAVKRF